MTLSRRHGGWYPDLMDAFNMTYYALVCGLLAGLSSRLCGWPSRIGMGAVVGLVAAAALPVLRAGLGIG